MPSRKGLQYSMAITETECGWLAGIWDGEGSVLLRVGGSVKNRCRNPPVRFCVSMVNTDEGIINKTISLLQSLGCSPCVYPSRDSHRNKLKWTVALTNKRDMEVVLRIVAPHLHGDKKSKAECLLCFLDLRKMKGKGRRYTAEERAVISSFHNQTNPTTGVKEWSQ